MFEEESDGNFFCREPGFFSNFPLWKNCFGLTLFFFSWLALHNYFSAFAAKEFLPAA